MANTKHYVKVTGVRNESKGKLEAIAYNLNVSVSSLLRPKIQQVINEYPPHMHVMPKPAKG